MAGIEYRQLQSPALIDTAIPDSGDAQAAQSLAHAFKTFETGLSGLNEQFQAKRGAQVGAAAGAEANFGKPGGKDFNRGFLQNTAYAEAYNNAATRSYAIRAQADAEDTAARLQVEANKDPHAFQATFGAVRDAVIKNAPAEARPALIEIYNKRLTEGVANLSHAQAQEAQSQARTDVSEGIQRSTDRIALLRASNDLDKHDEADVEQQKLGLLIDSARRDGTLTPIEADAAHKQSQKAITQQTVTARFRDELANPYGDPIGFIKRLKEVNKTSNALLPAEEEKLVDSLLSDLRESNGMAEYDIRKAKQEEHMRFEVGDRNATSDLLAGRLTQKKLYDLTQSQNLSPEVARTLYNELQKGDPGIDDSRVAFDVRTNLLHYSEQEIASMPGLKWGTRGDLLLKRREEAAGWKGTQAAREGEARIDRALGIVPGTMIQTLPDDVKTQRNQALTEWYNQVELLPPAERQGAVISKSEEVIGTYIRKAKSIEAQDLARAKANFIKRAGDPNALGKEERKKYDERLNRYDSDITAAQAEAARK